MTDRPNEISDVMEVAAKNPDLYSLLASDINLETLGLDQDRTSACEAARDHLRTQRIQLLRACHSALSIEMGNRISPKRIRPEYYFSTPWGGNFYIDFWILCNPNIRALCPQHVPLLVTFCTDPPKGGGLEKIADAIRKQTNAAPQSVDLWRPRVVWKAVPIRQGLMVDLAAEAVTGLRELFDSEMDTHSTTRARG